MYRILRREVFSDVTFLWEVEAPDVAAAALPGHFVMLRLHEGGERIPLTVADFDRERGTVTIVVQALGKTTREMRDEYAGGDTFLDFAGPLGLPQHVEQVGHVVLVGGGLGVAPVYPQLRAFKAAGNRTTSILGFRSQPLVFWEDRFRPHSDALIVCTDDGSYGRPGLVTEALRDVLANDRPDLVVAIGPLPMMRACVETTRASAVRTMVSLNAIMVDGTGMCGSCRVTVDGKVRFACVEGPDFDGHRVDFDELMARQRRFSTQESRASADYAHVCNLEQQLFEQGKRNYKKIKDLAPHQTPMPEREAGLRAQCFDEVNLGYTLPDALAEAERCIQCIKPTCIAGCPVAIDIPRFIRHLLVREFDEALETIRESNVFPSICGRVCPQESQCEAQCVIARKVEPVAIGRLERFVGDHARAAGHQRGGSPSGVWGRRSSVCDGAPMGPATGSSRRRNPSVGTLGRVAIVGSGPAGLACAADLARAGAQVTVFEALHVAGGVLRYGIPAFRLPREILDREIAGLRELGVVIETNKVVGKTFTVPQLLGERGFDAVFLGVGAGAPTFLGIPGEFAGQVYSANEFLTRVNLMGGDRFPYSDTPVALGQSVVVIGAGNTAMDCLRVSKRLGAKTVRCVYRRSEAEAPARVEELRHAREEGIEFFFLHAPVAILQTDAGDVRGMRVERMALGEADDGFQRRDEPGAGPAGAPSQAKLLRPRTPGRGRRKPIPQGEFSELECDTVIYALGTQPNPIVLQSTPGLALDARGYIAAAPDTQATALRGVFAGGDIVTGGATVILAMGAGRRAAAAIASWLHDAARSWPPVATALTGPTLAATARGCPRCGALQEGGESYVCCAHATLAWRCSGCGKVSEGFAFPYGLCPACGGTLVADAATAVADDAATRAIRTAFEIELGGRAFYERAQTEATDPALRELFGRFAAMEREHMATLSRRYHASVPEAAGGVPLDRAAIYTGLEHRPEDPMNLFWLAVAFEQRAVRFFETRVAQAVEGSPEWELYRELAAEEREHVALLETEAALYARGLSGVL